MEKMNIMDLIDNNGKFVDGFGDKIIVISYVGIKELIACAKVIANSVIVEKDNGFKLLNKNLLDMSVDLQLINLYSNIDMSSIDMDYAYDFLFNTGIYSAIFEDNEQMAEIKNNFMNIVLNEVDYLMQENKMENIFLNMIKNVDNQTSMIKDLLSIFFNEINESGLLTLLNNFDNEKSLETN